MKINDYIFEDAALSYENELYRKKWYKGDFDPLYMFNEKESENFNRFMNSFFYEYRMKSGSAIIDYILKNGHSYFSADELEHLEKIKNNFYSFFEIFDFEISHCLYVRDLLTDKEYKILEKSGTFGAQEGDAIFARLTEYDGEYIILYSDGGFPASHSYLIKRIFSNFRDTVRENEQLSSWFFHEHFEKGDDPEDSLTENLNLLKQVKNIFKKIYGKKLKFNKIQKELKSIDARKEIDPQVKSYVDLFKKNIPAHELSRSLDIFYRYIFFIQQKKINEESAGKDVKIGPIEEMLTKDLLMYIQSKTTAIKPDMEVEEINRLSKIYQKEWLEMPQKELDGKTPRQSILEERQKNRNPDAKIEFDVFTQRVGGIDPQEEKRLRGVKEKATRLFNKHAYKEAIPLFETLTKEITENYVDTFNLGVCHYNLGDIDKAEKYAKESIKINSKYTNAKELLDIINNLSSEEKMMRSLKFGMPDTLEMLEERKSRMEIIDPAQMETEEIIRKMTKMCPSFDLNEFKEMARDYIVAEEISDVYYDRGITAKRDEEDFIWMACVELWRRECPNLLCVDSLEEEVGVIAEKLQKENDMLTAADIDNLITIVEKYKDFMFDERGRLRKNVNDALEKRYWNIIEIFEDIPMECLNQKRYKLAEKWGLFFYDAFEENSCLLDAAEAQFLLGKKDIAEGNFRKVFHRHKNIYGLLNLALLYEQEKQYEKARKILIEALNSESKYKIKLTKMEIRDIKGRLADLKV